MNSSLGQIIVRIKQASNDIVVKRKRLENLKTQIKNTVNSIERENLKRKEIEDGLLHYSRNRREEEPEDRQRFSS